jgi:hypothetical protein
MKKKIIKIIPLVDKDLLELLIIRNEIINRTVSFKTKKISKKKHLLWFKKIQNLKKNFYFVAKYKNKIIGCIYFKNYPKYKNQFVWGFYTKSDINIPKLGSGLKFRLFDIIFNHYKKKKIYCEVKKGFEWIMQWHIRWSHKILKKSNTKYILRLDRDLWLKKRKKINSYLNPELKIEINL